MPCMARERFQIPPSPPRKPPEIRGFSAFSPGAVRSDTCQIGLPMSGRVPAASRRSAAQLAPSVWPSRPRFPPISTRRNAARSPPCIRARWPCPARAGTPRYPRPARPGDLRNQRPLSSSRTDPRRLQVPGDFSGPRRLPAAEGGNVQSLGDPVQVRSHSGQLRPHFPRLAARGCCGPALQPRRDRLTHPSAHLPAPLGRGRRNPLGVLGRGQPDGHGFGPLTARARRPLSGRGGLRPGSGRHRCRDGSRLLPAMEPTERVSHDETFRRGTRGSRHRAAVASPAGQGIAETKRSPSDRSVTATPATPSYGGGAARPAAPAHAAAAATSGDGRPARPARARQIRTPCTRPRTVLTGLVSRRGGSTTFHVPDYAPGAPRQK
jgi:hypothetical protein